MAVLTKSKLAQAVNDAARKITIRGSQAIVPLKVDRKGEVVTPQTQAQDLVLKRLTLYDFEFLLVWRQLKFTHDLEMIGQKISRPVDELERLIIKLSCFETEDAKIRALANIPTRDLVLAKDAENVLDPGSEINPTITDSQHKSLDRISRILGINKTNDVTITQNVFNLPKLAPEIELEFKQLAERSIDAEAAA